MVLLDRLKKVTERFAFLEAKMAEGVPGDEIAGLAREYSSLKPVAQRIETYRQLLSDREAAEAMLDDPEMRPLAEEELARISEHLPEEEAALLLALLPRDEADTRPVLLEIRPGIGGEEAALFAGDLLRMYMRYA